MTFTRLVPRGGSTGQVLAKSSGTDNAVAWVTPAGGSGASGVASVDFGAFPGCTDVALAVTGQTGILSGSTVAAWLMPSATADHSADEHAHESIAVCAGNVSEGVGFTVYARSNSQINEPTGRGTRLWGTWSVGWKWS